jgi:hypothetical protein
LGQRPANPVGHDYTSWHKTRHPVGAMQNRELRSLDALLLEPGQNPDKIAITGRVGILAAELEAHLTF